MADESTIVIVTGEGETAADASAESSLVAAGQVAAVTDDATRTGRQWGESAQTSDASGSVDPGDAAILAMFEDKPVTNVRREVIYDYSAASIAAYVAMGAVAYAVYDDGTEAQVPWSDVHEPDDEEDEIDDIATAINQHFWHDSNGAHVTDQEQDAWLEEYAEDGHGELASPTTQRPWHNILMNSLGVLIRSGLVDLAALSKSGVTFFDGNGNGSTNVVARFGSGGAQIGSPTSQHAVIDSNGMSVYNADGTLAEINTVDLRAVQAATAQAQADAASAASSASAAASAASAADAKAVQAATAASNAQADATAAAQAASVADGKAVAAGQAASAAQSSADAASLSAAQANTHATNALDQLGIVQDVVGVLDYAAKHGTFSLTSDTAVQAGKVYFTYDSQTGDYAPVIDPQASALSTYYELTYSDDSMGDFIMTHLAVTQRGLWVLPSGKASGTTPTSGESQADSDARQAQKYKVLLANDGLHVYDGAGNKVASYGESITFASTRAQYIGNEDAYILFTPEHVEGGQTVKAKLVLGGSGVQVGGGRALSEVLAELDTAGYELEVTATATDLTADSPTVTLAATVRKDGAALSAADVLRTGCVKWYRADTGALVGTSMTCTVSAQARYIARLEG